MFRSSVAVAVLAASAFAMAPTASAGPDEYLGEILTVGFNFCPRGTLEADGRLLPISSYTALFSLYGTTYGGDGRTTFALPDLRGRTIVNAGQGPGLTNRPLGQRGGTERNEAGPALAPKGPANNAAGKTTTGENMQPYLALKQCVVAEGIYPSRS
jgi:microcystin-dependent protein